MAACWTGSTASHSPRRSIFTCSLTLRSSGSDAGTHSYRRHLAGRQRLPAGSRRYEALMLQTIRRYGLMLVVRPLAQLLFGLDVIGREKLPKSGPAIVAANHNSHVDTIVLLCLFPSKLLPKIRPVAAADHFDKGGFGSWFSKNIIGIIPIKRGGAARGEDVLLGAKQALERGEILVLFPEGSRGEP